MFLVNIASRYVSEFLDWIEFHALGWISRYLGSCHVAAWKAEVPYYIVCCRHNVNVKLSR